MIISGKAEKAFPRGGVAKKKKSDTVVSSETSSKKFKENDDLFSTKNEFVKNNNKKQVSSELKKSKKKGKKNEKKEEEDDDILTVKQVDTLTYDDLSEGFTMLACISVIRDLELKLSLPGRLTATVPITQISKPYTDALKRVAEGEDLDSESEIRSLAEMFKVGQLVLCSVISIEKRDSDEFFYKITASLAPHVVQGGRLDSKNLQGLRLVGAVKSVEDYGYVMDIGLPSIQAFLPKKRVEKYSKEFLDGEFPTVGQLVSCVVTQLNGAAAKLSADPGKLRNNVTQVSKVTVHSILPGMTFETKVAAKGVKHGLRLNFGDLTGYVHHHHLEKDITDYEAEESVVANVLYVSPTINTVFFSLRDHTKLGSKFSDPFSKHKIGDIVNNVQVMDASSKGLTIRLDEDSLGFVPAKSISDSKVSFKDVKKEYLKGTIKQSCRIFQYDFIDQHFICSFQKSMLKPNQSIVLAENLKAGDKVSCTIKSFIKQGVLVDIGQKHVEAFIPHLYLTDVPMAHPEKKFSVGDKLACKVLLVDPSKRKIHLTSKPILVKKDDYDIVDSFDHSHVGKVTEGVVVKLSAQGLLLQLFGDVRGWVPKSKISTETVDHPEKLFFLGQALKCQVVDTEPDKERMTLSLILGDGKFKPLGKKEKTASEHLRLGSLYTCKVDSIAADGINVITVHVKKEEEEDSNEKVHTPVNCFIPTMHLTDHIGLASCLHNTFHVGDIIEEAVCFEKDAVPILSLKPSILQFAKSEPARSLADLHTGLVMPGVAALVKPYGVFLRLPTWKFRKSALVPTRLLADFFVENPRDFVQPYQTLYGQVVETDEEKQTVTMTTKRKAISAGETSHSVDLMTSFFDDLRRIRDDVTFKALSHLRLGTSVTCSVTEVTEFGLQVDVDGVRGLIPQSVLIGLEDETVYEVGDNLSAVVVFIDYQFSVVELSPDPTFVRQAEEAVKKPAPREGLHVKARVVLTRSSPYFYTSMCIQHPQNHAGQLIHVPTRHHLNDYEGHTDMYVVGDVHNVIVKRQDNEYLIGVLEKHERFAGRKRTRKNSVESATTKRVRKESVGQSTASENAESEIEKDKMETSVVLEEEIKTEDEIKVEIKEEDPGWEEEYNPWGVGLNGDGSGAKDGGDDDSAETGAKSKKTKTHLSKKEKKELDRLESEEIARAEQRVLDGEEAEPETAEEFDRLVLASPNSSLCWIKYMAFYIAKSDHDKAREIAKRALEKINFREEAERLNVYLAWFNMENACKNEEEAEKVFKEALKCNDQYSVYQRVATTYSQNEEQNEKAEKIYKIMARRFCKEPEVWTQLGQFYFKIKNLKDARFTLQRGLQNLEQKHHVDLSSKFAQMEFKLGDAERGKTIFENIVGNYPRRTDQWSVYVDMVIKKGEPEAAREIFDRMIQLNLQPKKMKFFFKKYLEFETAHGDQHRIDQVRKKALEYVESKFGVTDVDPVEHLMDTLEN